MTRNTRRRGRPKSALTRAGAGRFEMQKESPYVVYRFELRGISSGTDAAFPANHQHPIVAMVKAASIRAARASLLRSLMSHGWRDARILTASTMPPRPQSSDANERWLTSTAKTLGFAMIVDCRIVDEPFALNMDLRL